MNETQALMRQKAMEDMQRFLKEGIEYAGGMIYLVWIVLSLSLCSGMFVENPVQERFTKLRYYLGVLGLPQGIYWLGNLLFDYGVYLL